MNENTQPNIKLKLKKIKIWIFLPHERMQRIENGISVGISTSNLKVNYKMSDASRSMMW